VGDAIDVCAMNQISPTKIGRILIVCTGYSTGKRTCPMRSNPAA
jgi:hypothetical protein